MRMPFVQDTRMPSGRNLLATGASVRATKGVGTTIRTTSQDETTSTMSPVAVKLSGHLWPVCGSSRGVLCVGLLPPAVALGVRAHCLGTIDR